jgi:DNA-directed RNA polymerase subunit M/transcription elongation factor TFIIS
MKSILSSVKKNDEEGAFNKLEQINSKRDFIKDGHYIIEDAWGSRPATVKLLHPSKHNMKYPEAPKENGNYYRWQPNDFKVDGKMVKVGDTISFDDHDGRSEVVVSGFSYDGDEWEGPSVNGYVSWSSNPSEFPRGKQKQYGGHRIDDVRSIVSSSDVKMKDGNEVLDNILLNENYIQDQFGVFYRPVYVGENYKEHESDLVFEGKLYTTEGVGNCPFCKGAGKITVEKLGLKDCPDCDGTGDVQGEQQMPPQMPPQIPQEEVPVEEENKPNPFAKGGESKANEDTTFGDMEELKPIASIGFGTEYGSRGNGSELLRDEFNKIARKYNAKWRIDGGVGSGIFSESCSFWVDRKDAMSLVADLESLNGSAWAENGVVDRWTPKVTSARIMGYVNSVGESKANEWSSYDMNNPNRDLSDPNWISRGASHAEQRDRMATRQANADRYEREKDIVKVVVCGKSDCPKVFPFDKFGNTDKWEQHMRNDHGAGDGQHYNQVSKIMNMAYQRNYMKIREQRSGDVLVESYTKESKASEAICPECGSKNTSRQQTKFGGGQAPERFDCKKCGNVFKPKSTESCGCKTKGLEASISKYEKFVKNEINILKSHAKAGESVGLMYGLPTVRKDGKKIKGTLAYAGVSLNDRIYLPEELAKGHGKTLPLLLNHSSTAGAEEELDRLDGEMRDHLENEKDYQVGEVTLTWDAERLTLFYEGVIENEFFQKEVDDMDMAVSLGIFYDSNSPKVCDEECYTLIKGAEFREVSLVYHAGFPIATIEAVESKLKRASIKDIKAKASENACPECSGKIIKDEYDGGYVCKTCGRKYKRSDGLESSESFDVFNIKGGDLVAFKDPSAERGIFSVIEDNGNSVVIISMSGKRGVKQTVSRDQLINANQDSPELARASGESKTSAGQLGGGSYLSDSVEDHLDIGIDRWTGKIHREANEDSLIKIEDNEDADTQVTVLDEWKNETDPDVDGETKGIRTTKEAIAEEEDEMPLGGSIDAEPKETDVVEQPMIVESVRSQSDFSVRGVSGMTISNSNGVEKYSFDPTQNYETNTVHFSVTEQGGTIFGEEIQMQPKMTTPEELTKEIESKPNVVFTDADEDILKKN